MEHSFTKDDDYDALSHKYNTPKENEKAKSPKIKIKYSSPKRNKGSIPSHFSLLDGIKDDKNRKSSHMRKSSMPEDLRKSESQKVDDQLDSNRQEKKVVKFKKKDAFNRKFIRKNAKKVISPKKKKGGNCSRRRWRS